MTKSSICTRRQRMLSPTQICPAWVFFPWTSLQCVKYLHPHLTQSGSDHRMGKGLLVIHLCKMHPDCYYYVIYCVNTYAHMPLYACGGQRTTCGSQRSNADSQAWQQEPLLVEPSHQQPHYHLHLEDLWRGRNTFLQILIMAFLRMSSEVIPHLHKGVE